MPGLNLKAAQWEQQHKTHVEEYLRQIEALYDVASDELIRLGMGYKYQPNTGRLFAFSSNKSRSKQADASLSSFRNKLSTIITAGITSEWFFANDKNDSWVKQLFDNPKKGWMRLSLVGSEMCIRDSFNVEQLTGIIYPKEFGVSPSSSNGT